MSDADQEWKPSGRPQSTMAQAFSSALDSVFALDSEVDHLSQTIDQKRFQMLMKNRELEELQAKIRAAEERLKAQQANTSSGSGSPAQTEGGYQSTSSTTSPTDSAGQYSSSDELREQAQQRRT
ncbi:hypothetical protein Y699_02625 [Aspergillus terreus]|uniref:Uncharacterized protein n=1 Tax=Aspergillus terreus TaxID=33178 RepID=A0A5M3YLB6_ASPTE|nr:hypothetical protein ATETN484_0001029800 [Aspergillus terreus]GFF12154.1 hypothetical protein Y699_02625 [Aspergillus terreus]